MSDKYFTIKELSKVTGLSAVTLRRYLKNKKVNAQIVEGAYHISESEAEKVINLAKGRITDRISDQSIDQKRQEVELLQKRALELEQDKLFLQKDIDVRNTQIDYLLNEVKRLNDQIRLLITPQITGKTEPVTIFSIAERVKGFFTRSIVTKKE